MDILDHQSAVDIDGFIHLGCPESENYPFTRSIPSHFLPRLNKSQYTATPFDIDHLVTLGKITMDYRHSDLHAPTIEATTRENMLPGLLPNESMDSLSSDDSALTGADFLPRTSSETSLSLSPFAFSSRPSSSIPIMDIDHLIQIGTYPDTAVINKLPSVMARRTLDIDQYFDEVLLTELNTCSTEGVEMDIDNLLSIPSHHTFPMTSKSRQFLLKHHSLDIDNLIEIGASSSTFLGQPLQELQKVDHSTESTSQPDSRKHSTPSTVFRSSKSRFWSKCIGKLKKVLFF